MNFKHVEIGSGRIGKGFDKQASGKLSNFSFQIMMLANINQGIGKLITENKVDTEYNSLSKNVAMWHSMIDYHWSHQCSISEDVAQAPATPFMIWLPANVPGKAADDGTNVWVPASQWE